MFFGCFFIIRTRGSILHTT